MLLLRNKSPAVEQSARKLGNLPLQTGKAADMSELQTHHCTNQDSEPGSFAVWPNKKC